LFPLFLINSEELSYRVFQIEVFDLVFFDFFSLNTSLLVVSLKVV